jgi:hypothetical protein
VRVEGNREPLPFVGPHIDAAGPAGDYTRSPFNLTQILPLTADPSDVNAYLNGSFFNNTIIMFISSIMHTAVYYLL